MRDTAEARAEQFVPYSQHVAHGAIMLDNGSVVGGFRVAGRGWETADPDDSNAGVGRLAQMLRMHCGPRVVITSHIVRTLADPEDYPPAVHPSPFAADFDAAYRRHLFDRRLYRNDLYLFVEVQPLALPGVGIFTSLANWINENKVEAETETLDQLLRRLDDTMRSMQVDLAGYGVERMGTRREGRVLFSELGEALHTVLTTRRRKVPLLNGRLSRAIYQDRAVIGWETIEHRGLPESVYSAGFVMFEYPAVTWPGQFDNLLSAPYCFVLSQSFGGMSKAKSLGVVGRKQSQMRVGGDKAISQRDELTDASDAIASNRITMGTYHLSFMAFADDMRAIKRVAAQAMSDLADSGALVTHAHLELAGAYWAQLPGNMRFAPRPGAISNLNFASMAPMHNYPMGKAVGHWGEPVALFRTNGGTPYRYHLHCDDLGNTFISGPSGSGKTTLLLTVLINAVAQGAQVLLWDKDRGAEIACRAIGGVYLVLPNGQPSGCAPLKALTGSGEDIAFLAALVRGLIVGNHTYEMTAEDDRRLVQGLTILMRMPAEYRSLGELRAFLGVVDPEGAGARLQRWCAGSELGWVLDCARDEIAMDAPMLGFDMTNVLDNPDVRGPMMAYLFHRAEALIDGRRLVFAIDEFWKALLDPAFRDLVHDKLKTLRKQNAPVLLATQSPHDALASPIAHTIIEQCVNQIHMPNDKADPADYIRGLKLTEAEFRMVHDDMAGGGRRFLLKQGKTSVVCELDLSYAPDHVAVLSGRKESVNLLTRLLAEHGPDPSVWLPHFYAQWRSAT